MPEKNQNNSNHQSQKTEIGLVEPRLIEKEMEASYLDYAMSVIVSRALPDVRDGLKPVHRRVLYTMHEMGLDSRAKFRKSAAVVGDCLAKFHPHGDLAVYDSLARMTQDFAMRYPLIAGQGNWGSLDGDTPAAMRYTECKMASIAAELLSDIEKDTVDFMDNYDATRKEPKVLPAKLPNLLLNGSMGIAVGMATNIPPHNLKEVADAAIFLIDHPEALIDDLMKFILGPDFPTGGAIFDGDELKNAYVSGKGRIVMRAKTEIKETKPSPKQIIVTEIPYQVNKAQLVAKIAELVKNKKIAGIADIRDESDKEGVRIVIDLKKDTFAQKILNQLFQYTQMQEVFHLNMLALVDGIKPQVLNLKTILELYLRHRQEVTLRRTRFDLIKAQKRIHILIGLIKALKQISAIIETIKKSRDKQTAQKNLEKKFQLTSIQAENILAMRLATLAALERKLIVKEYSDLLKLAKKLQFILDHPQEILKIIKEELNFLKQKYGDDRKTKVFQKKADIFKQEDLIPNERVIITLTQGNYIKRSPITTYRSQHRGGKGVVGITTKEEDLVEQILMTNNLDDLLYFSSSGKVFSTKVYEIVQGSRLSKGQAIANLLKIPPEDAITSVINITDSEQGRFLLMVTDTGLIKKTPLAAFKKIRKSGVVAIKLRRSAKLSWVKTTSGTDQIIIITKLGQAIKFSEKDIRPMGRATSGVRGIKLRSNDKVIGIEVVGSKKEIMPSNFISEISETGLAISKKTFSADLLVITQKGCGKKTPLRNYPLQRRGGIGIRTLRLSERTGFLSRAKTVEGEKADLAIISKKGHLIRIPIKAVKRLGRATSGIRLMKLNQGDSVASIIIIEKSSQESEVPKAPKPQKPKKSQKSALKSSKIKKIDKKIKKNLKKIPKKNLKPKIKDKPKKAAKILKKTKKGIGFQKKHIKGEPNYWGKDASFWQKKKI